MAKKRGPLTATLPVLLDSGSDQAFRQMVYDLFTVASRLEKIRRLLCARMGLSGPQYSILMSVAELEDTQGISVGAVAKHLHVTSALVTVEAGRLAERGYLTKTADTSDRRIARLRVARTGRAAIQSVLPELQQINNAFFDLESRAQFDAVAAALQRLVNTSARALTLIAAASRTTGLRVHNGGLSLDARPSRRPATRRSAQVRRA